MPSALETDLNPNTYIGLSFPLRRDKFNDFAMTKNSLQQAHHNLKNLLLTSPGERAMQPEFGSNMRAICFEQIDDNLPLTIETEVRNAVELWLPYINIQEVKERLENHIWLKAAIVERQLPSTIYIAVIERTPIAIWQFKQKLYLVDAEGNRIAKHQGQEFDNLIQTLDSYISFCIFCIETF